MALYGVITVNLNKKKKITILAFFSMITATREQGIRERERKRDRAEVRKKERKIMAR